MYPQNKRKNFSSSGHLAKHFIKSKTLPKRRATPSQTTQK